MIFSSATLQTAAIEGDSISVELIASDDDNNIAYCDLSIDDVFIRRDSSAPYQYGLNSGFNDSGLNDLSAGSHTLTAECVDTTELSATNITSIDIASNPNGGDGEAVLRDVALNWTTPTTRTDGSPLSSNEIDHYEIYYSSTSANGDDENTISVAAINSSNQLINDYEITALPVGEYYFSIATVDTLGIASEFINPIALTIQ
ncbi:Ig-like domain-containing protein [bacterium]|nr:Ig-like domain-containing protein [bacterium]